MSIRTERVASVIREALTKPLSDISSETQAGFITVTHVRVSPDLRHAKVYLSIFGGRIEPERALKKVRDRGSAIRRHLGSAVHLRYTPDLTFFLDDTLDSMERIQRLIDESREKDAARQAGQNNDNTNDPKTEATD